MIRAVHFDMKSMTPTPEYALTLIDALAEQGFNAVLVEFEDKFPFDSVPEARHGCAWSKAQFRAFGDRCRERGVELIPLLQSIGHLDYLLRHAEYAGLREGGVAGTTYQWCLSNPESLTLWRRMAEEILDLFPEVKIFHIGADECRTDTHCDRCGSADRFELFFRRVKACADFVRSGGRRVLLWDDMFRRHGVARLRELPPGTLPCVWMYREIDEPYIAALADAGVEFWGASCLQAHRRYFAMGPQEPKMDNVDDWARIHARYPVAGHIGTIWGRIQSLSPIDSTLPQSLYLTAYLSETLRRGAVADRTAFGRNFAAGFLGAAGFDFHALATAFYYEPERAGRRLQALGAAVTRHRDAVEIWTAFNALDKQLSYIDMCFAHNEAMAKCYRAGLSPDELTDNYLDGVRRTDEDTAAVFAELTPRMERYFPRPLWEEFLDSRFSARFERNAGWRVTLTAARERWHARLTGAPVYSSDRPGSGSGIGASASRNPM